MAFFKIKPVATFSGWKNYFYQKIKPVNIELNHFWKLTYIHGEATPPILL